VVLFSLDREGVFTLSEGQGLNLLNLKPGEVVGKSAYEVYKDYPVIVDLLHQAVEGKISRAVHDMGHIVFDVSYTPLKDADGSINTVIGVAVEITERKRAEEREQAITRGLRAVVEAADELITVEDIDTFYRRAVELAREKLKVERGAIFLLNTEKQNLIGTYGTDEQGHTTDEHGIDIKLEDNPELMRRSGEPWWVTQNGERTAWDGKNIHAVGSGWIATTIIRIGDEPIGIFSNDAAITDSLLDPTQQESIVIYCSLLGNILKRKRAEEALRESEEVATEFQERLRALHEVSLELSGAQIQDNELYYRAVELGMNKLGFERLVLFFYDKEKQEIRGTFGTDEAGHIRDERGSVHSADEAAREIELVRGGERARIYENTVLLGNNGVGWDALSVLWNGNEGIGFLCTDNLFSQQPPRSYTLDLLALYGNLLGNLITQKQTGADLRASENRYRIVSGLMSDYAFAFDVEPDGSLVQSWITEDSFKRTTGYTWEELGTSYILYYESDAEKAQQDIEKTIKGQITEGEYRIVTKSGEMKWLSLSRQPEWDAEQKRVVRFYGVAQDITERKRLEAEIYEYTQQLEERVKERTAELSRAKEQIEAILNNISDAIVLTNHRGQIQTTNPAFHKMFGDQVSTAIEDFLKLVADNRQAIVLAESLATVIDIGGSTRNEARVTLETGQEIDLDLALISINEQDSENAAVLLSAHDITYLKEVERFKTRFVANAVHDLSSPITALGTRLYLLKKTPERLADHVSILEEQILHLKDLVTDLRSLSELDRGLAALTLETINFNELVMKIFNQYEPLAASKNLQMSVSLTRDAPLLRLDRRKVDRIIVNLVANAIHYTLDGGKIDIKTQLMDGNLILSVQDEGIGISKEDLPHIFERFYRSDDARSTNNTGTGLGLSIVKEMITAHGGTITVESEVGKGSIFTVKFPLQDGLAHS
jgi:PAS domain S-box-containing protein